MQGYETRKTRAYEIVRSYTKLVRTIRCSETNTNTIVCTIVGSWYEGTIKTSSSNAVKDWTCVLDADDEYRENLETESEVREKGD